MIAFFSIHRPFVQRIHRHNLHVHAHGLGDVYVLNQVSVARKSIQFMSEFFFFFFFFFCSVNELTGHGLELELVRVLGLVACDIHISCVLCKE